MPRRLSALKNTPCERTWNRMMSSTKRISPASSGCAFGGADLDTLFVTSARFTMSAEHLAAYPFEGGLFALRPGVRGMPANRFG